ncbi:MAG: MFS transporter, partial [Actinomycetota bacterium]
AGAVGVVSSSTRLGFEALVQREAPEAVRGRAFARFETLFQVMWVIGAALPTVAPIGIRPGLIAASVLYGLTALWFLVTLGREGRARLG